MKTFKHDKEERMTATEVIRRQDNARAMHWIEEAMRAQANIELQRGALEHMFNRWNHWETYYNRIEGTWNENV